MSDPKTAAALRTFQAIARLHFFHRRPKSLVVSGIDEPLKSGDSGRAPDEQLNSAGITRYVGLLLFGQPYFTQFHAHWAWEKRSSV